MARIEQVIHVKGTDGTVRECALFDSASDIPSPATAREFGLNGAKIYGAVLQGNDFAVGTDEQWLYGNSGTEFAFHDGSSEHHLLTTPYFVRPKTDALEFGADGGTAYLEDLITGKASHEGILSTNGTYAGYSCDYDGISVVNEGSLLLPQYAVVCAENSKTEDIAFTLVLTFSFADGSTQGITFSGTQAAAEVKEAWLRVDPDSLTFDGDGGNQNVSVDSSTGDFSVEGTSGTWLSASKLDLLSGEIVCSVRVSANEDHSARSGTVTLANDDGCEAKIAVEQEAGTTPVPGEERTLTINISKTGASTDDWTARNSPTVSVIADGEVVTGSATITSVSSMTWVGTTADGAYVEYTVSKDGYVKVTGSVTMDSDRTVNVTLIPS